MRVQWIEEQREAYVGYKTGDWRQEGDTEILRLDSWSQGPLETSEVAVAVLGRFL